MRVLIAGGGTGGHVIPALAVGEELLAAEPNAAVLYVGARGGLEERLVPEAGFDLELLSVGKLKGSGLAARLRTLAGLPSALVRALTLLRRFDPQVVVGVGGYASGPLALAARLARRPLLLLEQNAIPGSTNRFLARLAHRVATSFDDTPGLPGHKIVCVGNPLRPALRERLSQPRSAPALETRAPRLFILGGSQGARRLNELAVEVLPRLARALPRGLEVVHQTGPADEAMVREAYAQVPPEVKLEASAEAFIGAEIADHYRWADLALCRSGATTIAELGVAGLPAVLVPYPYAANDHQAANAKQVVAAGGALMERQDGLHGPRLEGLLGELFAAPERLAEMSEGMRSCGRPQAAAAVLQLLRELAH